jgi:hypothetical protein
MFGLLLLVTGVIIESVGSEAIESAGLIVAVAVWIIYTLYARRQAYTGRTNDT